MEAQEHLLFPQRKLFSKLHCGPLVSHKVDSMDGDKFFFFHGIRSSREYESAYRQGKSRTCLL